MPGLETHSRTRKQDFDAIVVGGGIAGSAAAKALGEKGLHVAVVEKRKTPPEKSLFINGTNPILKPLLDNLQPTELIPCDNLIIVNADGISPKVDTRPMIGNTFSIFHRPIIDYFEKNYDDLNVEKITDRVTGSVEMEEGVEITLANRSGGRPLRAPVVIDATGNYSQLSRMHKVGSKEGILYDDPMVWWVRGVRGTGQFLPNTLVIVTGKEVGVSWILPYSDSYGDIIAADLAKMSELDVQRQNATLTSLSDFCQRNGYGTIDVSEVDMGSFIRVQPMPRSAARNTDRLYAVGESAGMGSPHLAEVVPQAMYWGEHVAEEIVNGKTPAEFYHRWRREEQLLPYDLEFALRKKSIKHAKNGIYGTNAAIYQTVVDSLPEDVQKAVLTDRRLPKGYLPHFVWGILMHPQSILPILDTSAELLKIKISNFIQDRK